MTAMANERSPIDLRAPFEVDRLLEVRTSRMKTMPGLAIESGIDKTLCAGPMKVDKLGIQGDEHDPTFHGGPDKAIHGYCSSHYPEWQQSYPESADKFVPGGFGENFVTKYMNERNVCIGDVISVGPEVVLQVSLPRQPCFKLNHRFSVKNFAPKTYQSSRTGWYYRVLQEGTVAAGDEIRLVERKWPQWTIERLQEYLHRDKDNFEMNKELSEVEALGDEAKGQFKSRVAKAAKAKEPPKQASWTDFKITSRKMETPRIVSLVLEAVDPDYKAGGLSLGAHAKIKLPNGLVRSYSIVSASSDYAILNRLELGIALDENSRGGSKYLHEEASVGDILQVDKITTDIKMASMASNHLFIIGGIGLTAFIEMIKGYRSINFNCQVHYAVKSAEDIPFQDRLEPINDVFTYYDKSKGERMDIESLVKSMTWNTQLYVCGPDRMMRAAQAAVKKCGTPLDEVHFEAFAADISGDPFEASVTNKNGKILKVGGEETLLDVLRREFKEVASSCEVGNCGTCKVTVKEGRIDHRGTALSEEERKTTMLSCVSRGIGRIAIEI